MESKKGRPALPEGQANTEQVRLVLSPELLEQLDRVSVALSQEKGRTISRSETLRELIRRAAPPA